MHQTRSDTCQCLQEIEQQERQRMEEEEARIAEAERQVSVKSPLLRTTVCLTSCVFCCRRKSRRWRRSCRSGTKRWWWRGRWRRTPGASLKKRSDSGKTLPLSFKAKQAFLREIEQHMIEWIKRRDIVWFKIYCWLIGWLCGRFWLARFTVLVQVAMGRGTAAAAGRTAQARRRGSKTTGSWTTPTHGGTTLTSSLPQLT